jgi:acetyl esterase/lipase
MSHHTPLHPALLAVLSLSLVTPALADDGGRMLFDFARPDAAQAWQPVNDGVMGGVSEGRFRITDRGTMEFFGTLSLENNGGFASVRSRRSDLGLNQDDTLLIRLKGDGREYLLNLYVPTLKIASSYRAAIPTKAGEWTEVKIPLKGCYATSFGEKVPDAGPVDAAKIDSIGFMLSDKKAGPFKLEVAWVRVVGGPDSARSGPTTRTFAYKTIPGGTLEMVVHFPPDSKDSDKRPAVVFFFGGGWANGNMEQFETQADHLAGRGMVAARADYRVKSRQGVTPDRCVEDAKSAARWLRANAARLGIDPDRIVAAGGSAGGHIAACTALTEGLEAEGEDRSISSRPNALVLFNPVLRFDGVPQLMSRIGDDEVLGKSLSPTLHVTKDTPPTLVMFGTADRLKPQGDESVRRAGEAGFRAEVFTAEGQPHGFFNRPPWLRRTTARMDEFLTSLGYLKSEGDVKAEEP